jgi:hypothetical protein
MERHLGNALAATSQPEIFGNFDRSGALESAFPTPPAPSGQAACFPEYQVSTLILGF